MPVMLNGLYRSMYEHTEAKRKLGSYTIANDGRYLTCCLITGCLLYLIKYLVVHLTQQTDIEVYCHVKAMAFRLMKTTHTLTLPSL